MHVSPYWSANIDTSMCRSPLENVSNEFLLISPVVFGMSCSLIWMICEMGGKWPRRSPSFITWVVSGCSSAVLVWFGLVCWVLWHINLCRLFNAKSIFM